MKRRQYIGTVGSIALTPIATTTEVRASSDEEENPTLNEIKEASTAYVKRYDAGTVVTVAIPQSIDALSISVEVETPDDQLDHLYIDTARQPIETLDDKHIWHFFHQFRDVSHNIHLNRSGRENIEVEKTEQNILGNPEIDFVHDETRKVGRTNFATIRVLDQSGVEIRFHLDSEDDYDWLSFETFDKESESWVEHRWEQKYIEKFDEARWVNMCGCDRPMPTVLRSRGRLKLFGVKNGEKEHIPIIRRRGDIQR